MIKHTDTQQPAPPQENLVLPAVPPEQQQQPSWGYTNPHIQVSPAMLIRHSTPPPPRSPFAKLVYFWRKDPAYKVLMIAVAMVVIAGLLLTTLATNTLLHGFGGLASGGSGVQNPGGTTQPVATVDNKPTFPTPGGGHGSTVTSQPPMQSTPNLQPNPTSPPQPTTTPGPQGGLTVQITSIPNRVKNNTDVNVSVSTNTANIKVALVIYYPVFPFRSTAGPVTTDNNGNADLGWFISIHSFSNRIVNATVYAVARDQNGQAVRSQAAIVQVYLQGGGGF
jgi:hypothetical protein